MIRGQAVRPGPAEHRRVPGTGQHADGKNPGRGRRQHVGDGIANIGGRRGVGGQRFHAPQHAFRVWLGLIDVLGGQHDLEVVE